MVPVFHVMFTVAFIPAPVTVTQWARIFEGFLQKASSELGGPSLFLDRYSHEVAKVNFSSEKHNSTSSPSSDLSDLRTEKRAKSTFSVGLKDEDPVETDGGGMETVHKGLLSFGDVSRIGRYGTRAMSMEES